MAKLQSLAGAVNRVIPKAHRSVGPMHIRAIGMKILRIEYGTLGLSEVTKPRPVGEAWDGMRSLRDRDLFEPGCATPELDRIVVAGGGDCLAIGAYNNGRDPGVVAAERK